MLVLSRKATEQILIGDSIRITLLRVEGRKVKIGIDAPKDLRVIRGELVARDEQADEADLPGQVTAREEAFAHPQSPRRHLPAESTSKLDGEPAAAVEPALQTVLPQPKASTPPRAPLAAFMTAG
jgi:carbon storage regulator CsrA